MGFFPFFAKDEERQETGGKKVSGALCPGATPLYVCKAITRGDLTNSQIPTLTPVLMSSDLGAKESLSTLW